MSNLIRSRGIVLRRLTYSEGSLIVHALTEEHGLLHFIINSVRSAKSKGKSGTLQVGHILELVYYHHPTKDLHRLKEVRIAHPYTTANVGMYRLASTQYLVDLTAQALYQSGQLPVPLYPLLSSCLIQLHSDKPPTALAIIYLWRLIDRLGLLPDLSDPADDYLNLHNGIWMKSPTIDGLSISATQAQQLYAILQEEAAQVTLRSPEKATLLDLGHAYLALHLPYFKTPRTSRTYRQVLTAELQ